MTTEFRRTPDDNFAGLRGFDYPPNYLDWEGLRMHYVDAGPADGPVCLLLHGMPTWSYLYRTMIPTLVRSGYRCVAPDHIGFGRSDKPTDPTWYSIGRHTEVLSSLILGLKLDRITLVCQDWGGPIGLSQTVHLRDRFERAVVMNTWLHHGGAAYSAAIRSWQRNWEPGGMFTRGKFDPGYLLALSAGHGGTDVMNAMVGGPAAELPPEAEAMRRGFSAPFAGLPDDALAGARRFPASIPIDGSNRANAAAQQYVRNQLRTSGLTFHFIWGATDDIFPVASGREWATELGATFAEIAAAGHFLQNTHGPEIADLIIARIAEE